MVISRTAIAAAPDLFGVAIAWDDLAAGRRFVGFIDNEAPTEFGQPPIEVPGDGLVRFALEDVFHVSREAGVITRIDAQGWQIERIYSLGASAEPRDIAVVDPTTAYVSDRSLHWLIRLDLVTGALVQAVDPRPLGVSAGVLMPETMLVDSGRLYLQLRRPLGSNQVSGVAVIDLASEAIVDADPVQRGEQSIALAGSEPRFKMQIIPETNRLMLSATGALLDAGGLETIDLDTLQSEGLALEDQRGGVGVNDLGSLTLVVSLLLLALIPFFSR